MHHRYPAFDCTVDREESSQQLCCRTLVLHHDVGDMPCRTSGCWCTASSIVDPGRDVHVVHPGESVVRFVQFLQELRADGGLLAQDQAEATR